jgi:hypothetical protein
VGKRYGDRERPERVCVCMREKGKAVYTSQQGMQVMIIIKLIIKITRIIKLYIISK